MKKFSFDSAKVVGTATDKSWSQVHLFSPTDADKKHRRGELLAALSLSGLSEGIESVAAGREIISRLHEEYYGDLEEGSFKKLALAVRKVCLESKTEAKIEIGAAAIVGDVIYFAISGQGQAILKRESRLGILTIGEEGVSTISGHLKEGDVFVLGTTGFFQNLAMGVLKAALASDSPFQAAEALAPIIHGKNESGTDAAIIFKIKETVEDETTLETVAKIDQELINEEKSPSSLISPTGEINAQREEIIEKGENLSFKQGKVSSLKTKVDQKISRILTRLQKRLEEKTIYLKREGRRAEPNNGLRKKPERSKKTIFTVLVVLLTLLAISVTFGAQQRKHSADKQGVSNLLQEAKEKKEEAESLLELNPAKAKTLLLEAQILVQKVDEKNYQDPDFNKFKDDLEKILNLVLKEYRVEITVFFDLGLIKPEAKGDDWTFSGGKLIILDGESSTIFEVDVGNKSSSILAGGKNLSGANRITAFLPKIYVITPNGIIENDKQTKKEKLVVETESKDTITDMKIFNNNLYLLATDGKIWQYLAEAGFSPRQNWLKEGANTELTDAVSMAIDGSIWILKTDGQIIKFTRGRKDAFGLSGLPKETRFPTKPVSLYTNEDSENLYLWDQEALEILVFNKSGEYQSSYSFLNPPPDVNQCQKLIVSEKDRKFFLLGRTKIYQVEMKSSAD